MEVGEASASTIIVRIHDRIDFGQTSELTGCWKSHWPGDFRHNFLRYEFIEGRS